jgi:hypothetical protein
MQHSKIKIQYEKNCAFCKTALKWQDNPVCDDCMEALKTLVLERKLDISRTRELNKKLDAKNKRS